MPFTTLPKLFRTLILGILVLFSILACQSSLKNTSTSLPGTGISIQTAFSLPEEQFQTVIINRGLEQLGYTIAPPQKMTYSTMFLALSQGNLDLISVYWERSHAPLFQSAGGENNLTVLGNLTPNLVNGYQMDRKTAEQYQITTLDQLKDRKIAQLFDTDGDGKANLAGCDPGWTCEKVIDYHIKAYGLEDTVEQDKANYNALMLEVISRYQQGKPILYYTWTPFWVASVLNPHQDVIWLNVPHTTFPDQYQQKITAKDTSIGDLNLGFIVDRMRVVGNKNFIDANPAARKFLELVQIPVEDINRQNQRLKEGENTPDRIRSHVEEWMNNHPEFETWVDTARATRK